MPRSYARTSSSMAFRRPTTRTVWWACRVARGLAGRSRIDSTDLRALQAEPCHQPFLVEEDRIDIVFGCHGREGRGGAGVQNDDARASADLPAVVVSEILQRRVTHEEQGIAKL